MIDSTNVSLWLPLCVRRGLPVCSLEEFLECKQKVKTSGVKLVSKKAKRKVIKSLDERSHNQFTQIAR